jgi:hypothetical protein
VSPVPVLGVSMALLASSFLRLCPRALASRLWICSTVQAGPCCAPLCQQLGLLTPWLCPPCLPTADHGPHPRPDGQGAAAHPSANGPAGAGRQGAAPEAEGVSLLLRRGPQSIQLLLKGQAALRPDRPACVAPATTVHEPCRCHSRSHTVTSSPPPPAPTHPPPFLQRRGPWHRDCAARQRGGAGVCV